MAAPLPYMTSYGLIEKALNKIKEAQTPPRFTQDFLGTHLGMSSGSAMSLIPLFKKLGFLGSDGAPTESYKKFRNETTSKAVMAGALREAYKDIYSRNEYAHKLSREKLIELVKEITGAAQDSSVVRFVVSTFETLKKFADFEGSPLADSSALQQSKEIPSLGESVAGEPAKVESGVRLGLSYTINLNLPATTDVTVFNAIFRSLKENLLQSS